MAGKRRFHIPTSSEMDQGPSSESVKSLFQSHQAVVKSNIKNKTPADDSFTTRTGSGMQKSATGASSNSNVQQIQKTKSGTGSSLSITNNQSSLTLAAGKNTSQPGSGKLGQQINGKIPSQQTNSDNQGASNKSTGAASTALQKRDGCVNGHGSSITRGSCSGTVVPPKLAKSGPVEKAAGSSPNINSSDSRVPPTTGSDPLLPFKTVGTPVTPPRPGGNASSLIVSARQRGNPVLKFIRNVPWEYGDIVPDYVMGQTSCALFLSLRYHQLNNNYIHERLKKLGHSFNLRVLLVQVDIKDPHHCLKELAKICLLADCTLILAWSPEEAGRYLETYKSFENKPPDLIMEKVETNFVGRVSDFLTCAKKVNKTDAMTLLSTFGTVAEVVQASEEDMSLCPGFGPQKAKRLHNIFHEPFLKSKKQKASQSEQAQPYSGTSAGASTKPR